ncbi:MAG: hypothetical protein CMO34_07925 [Verrucomicrobia bacterium]|nr:hypothetical protein [Verrucomicrobiota bacterium]
MKGFIFGILFASLVFFGERVHDAIVLGPEVDREIVVPNYGTDQYEFPSRINVVQDQMTLFVEIYPSFESLQEAHDEVRVRNNLSIVDNDRLIAFTETWSDNSNCVIHMVDPRVRYLPEFYGHELLHCVYDQWHEVEY